MSKFCQRCGAQLPDNAPACNNCGFSFNNAPNQVPQGNQMFNSVPQGNQMYRGMPQGNAMVKPKKKHGCLIGIGAFVAICIIIGAVGGNSNKSKSPAASESASERTNSVNSSEIVSDSSTEDEEVKEDKNDETDDKLTLSQVQKNVEDLKEIKEDVDTIIDIKEDIDTITGNDDKDKKKESNKDIEYTKATVTELVEELDSNSLRAQKTYKDKYLELTGKFTSADSDGEYFSLGEADNAFSFRTIYCRITDDSQLDKLMDYNTDDIITIKCQITDVGEVLGYYADVIEIE